MSTPDKPKFFKVPDPFPLTIVGLFAALGPQAINFGISWAAGKRC